MPPDESITYVTQNIKINLFKSFTINQVLGRCDHMILQNEICHIEINIDETYTVDSVDNRHYDVTLNPEHYRHNDLSKTLSIHIGLYAREFQVALIGPYHSYDLDCAVLQDDILTVLQDNMITQIKITDAGLFGL